MAPEPGNAAGRPASRGSNHRSRRPEDGAWRRNAMIVIVVLLGTAALVFGINVILDTSDAVADYVNQQAGRR